MKTSTQKAETKKRGQTQRLRRKPLKDSELPPERKSSGGNFVFIPIPEAYQWDHPFPPLTDLQLKLLGCGTLFVSLLPIWILKKRGLLKFSRLPQFQNMQ
jgi:hypothetical protein